MSFALLSVLLLVCLTLIQIGHSDTSTEIDKFVKEFAKFPADKAAVKKGDFSMTTVGTRICTQYKYNDPLIDIMYANAKKKAKAAGRAEPDRRNFGEKTIDMVFEYKKENDVLSRWTILIPPVSKIGNRAWLINPGSFEKKYSMDRSYVEVEKQGEQYTGIGSWLSTKSEVAITPGWGAGGDVSRQGVRMINDFWKRIGVNQAKIQDAARFKCGAVGTKYNPTKEKGRNQWNLGRILRLFQGKKDFSIYNLGGYKYEFLWGAPDYAGVSALTKDKYVKEAAAFEGYSNDIQEATTDDAVKEVQATESSNKNNFRNRMNKAANKKPLMKDTFVTIYGPPTHRNCKEMWNAVRWLYESSGEVIPSIAKANAGGISLKLKKWVQFSTWLYLENIQATTFDLDYYQGIAEGYDVRLEQARIEYGNYIYNHYIDYDDYEQDARDDYYDKQNSYIGQVDDGYKPEYLSPIYNVNLFMIVTLSVIIIILLISVICVVFGAFGGFVGYVFGKYVKKEKANDKHISFDQV